MFRDERVEPDVRAVMADRSEQRDVVVVLTDAFAPFHREVVDQIEPHFARVGLGTLGVIGREVSSDRLRDRDAFDPEQLRSLGARFNVRGAVIVSGAIPPSISEDEVLDFAHGLTDGPTVSFGIAVPGLPSTVIRWQETIDELVGHLLADPRRQRFAFVRGYADDPHSLQRESGLRAGMRAAGLPIDERLFVRGNYNRSDAMAAVSQLLEDGHRFDGLLAANDDMAVGAIAALTRHDLSVPHDVVVAGFDDSLASFDSVPPLTTAHLDIARLAEQTARLMIDSVRNHRILAPDLRVEIDSRVIVRESTRPEVLDTSADRRPLGSDPRRALRQHLWERWETSRARPDIDLDELADAIVSTVLDGDTSFTDTTAWLLRPDRRIDATSIASWRHVLRTIRTLLIECHPEDLSVTGVQATLDQIASIDARISPVEKSLIAEEMSRRELLRRLTMNLADCQDTDDLWAMLRLGLRQLGLERAWVATDDPRSPGGVRLAFSLDADLRGSPVFSSADLLPDAIARELERHLNVLVPLRAGAETLGYMVADPNDIDLLGLASIASEIAQVLRHHHQVDALQDRAEQLHEANRALDRLSRTDPLTGLANRKELFERLHRLLAERTDDEVVAVLFFDLDGFKRVNDTLGHAAGDELLRSLSARIAGLLDAGDTFARIGGDEFTITFRGPAGSGRARRLADDVRRAVATPFALSDGIGQLSASIGLACAPGDGDTGGELMRHADMAMYDAKTGGKNSVVRYRRGEDLASTPADEPG